MTCLLQPTIANFADQGTGIPPAVKQVCRSLSHTNSLISKACTTVLRLLTRYMSCLTFVQGNITFNDEVKVVNMLEYQLLSIGVIGVLWEDKLSFDGSANVGANISLTNMHTTNKIQVVQALL